MYKVNELCVYFPEIEKQHNYKLCQITEDEGQGYYSIKMIGSVQNIASKDKLMSLEQFVADHADNKTSDDHVFKLFQEMNKWREYQGAKEMWSQCISERFNESLVRDHGALAEIIGDSSIKAISLEGSTEPYLVDDDRRSYSIDLCIHAGDLCININAGAESVINEGASIDTVNVSVGAQEIELIDEETDVLKDLMIGVLWNGDFDLTKQAPIPQNKMALIGMILAA